MLQSRRRRILGITIIVLVLSVVVALVLYALRQNIDLYFTPSQLLQQSFRGQPVIRLGGIVVPKSLQHPLLDRLQQNFVLRDSHHRVSVKYHGVLPALFHDGQGIIVQGHWYPKQHDFVATQVLAKHDSDYHPPGITL